MVTNTAGTTTDTLATKENGDCKKDNEISDEKTNASDNLKSNPIDKPSGSLQNDSNITKPHCQAENSEDTNFFRTSAPSVMSENSSYNSRVYGNGLSTMPPASMEGPNQGNHNVSRSNYGSMNNGSPAAYSGPRAMQSNSNFSMQQRYPTNQQPPAATPTLNQLLTTPSRHPSQYTNYGNQSNQPPQSEYGPGQHQSWPAKPQQQLDRSASEQAKSDQSNFPTQQQYPAAQLQANYSSHYARYPSPAGGQSPYNHPPQAPYNNMMMGSGQSGYPPSNAPAPVRHPNYPGYPNYSQQSPFYGQRPPGSYTASTSNQSTSADSHAFYQQQEQLDSQPNASQIPDKMYQQSKDSMMSPNRRTPQPSAGPGSAPSPMNVSQAHPGHPSVAHFRGPPSAPASPSVTSRGTPLSPASVRSDAPQPPMRPASGHSEHSNPPVPSPLSGAGTSAYGTYRSHSSQPSYAWQQQSNYPQRMMSPQHQPAYSGSQPAPTPQAAAGLRQPSGPSSVGKPVPSSQPYSQSQPSPAFQQSGVHLPYYDNMPQGSHVMQGYSSASPAPSERRPSRQGSQTPVVQTPDANTRQGAAAAAAAAAMAAAAHTAHPVNAPSQKQPAPNFYPQGQQQPRPQHPNYNNMQQQSMEMNQSNVNYPRMGHPGPVAPVPGPNRMMGPPGITSGPNQGTYRMPPPSHYAGGYGQPMGASPQQGQYPGYYPQGPGDPSHPPGPRPGYQPPQSYQQQHTPEETTKKPAARAASQKLHALYEPEEPGRREFIEGLLRYWEEKEVPLKNAPLMGRKTLDLFRLYHVIKDRGGMQEVTANKKWSEICAMLGMGTAATSGFTLKKQYCKYLYGYECKVDKGIPEPQEAMARVTEANRKRKQAQENSKDVHHPPGMPAQPSMMHPLNASGAPPQAFPGQQYPPGQYPPNQHYQMPLSHPAPGYMMQSNPASTSNAYPRHPGPVNTNMPQPGVPAPSYPNAPNAGPRPWHQPGQAQPPRPGLAPPSQPPMAPESGQLIKKNEETPIDVKQSLQLTSDTNLQPPSVDPNQAIKAAAPTSVPTPHPFSDAANKQYSTSPATSQVYPNQESAQQPYPVRAPLDPHRSAPLTRPGIAPSQYPYSNSTLPHPSPLRGPSLSNDMRGSPSPGPRTPYQPSPPLTTRPVTSVPHPMGGGPYTGQAPVGNSFPGLKRQSNETYGPPRKLLHREGPQPYGLNHPSYRPGVDMLRHRFANSDPSAPGYRPPNPGALATAGQSRLHPPYSAHRFPRYMSDKSRGHQYSAGPRALKNRLQSPLTASLQKYPHDPRPNLKRQLQMPSRTLPQHFKREVALFPSDSVEATHLRLSKFQRKSCHNVGLIEAWRLIMSLKSGLLVESSWALNALTILLYDQRSVAQLRLSHLPGLLDTVVEHHRRCLAEIFCLPAEQEALGLSCRDDVIDDVANEVFETEEVTVVSKPKHGKRKRKGSAASKLKRRYTSYKVKVESRSDAFLEDHSHQWDVGSAFDLTDDLSHIILSLSKEALFEKLLLEKEIHQDESHQRCVEATLEDILSIPCSVLSPDDYDIMKSSMNLFSKKSGEDRNPEKNQAERSNVVEKSENSSAAENVGVESSATKRPSDSGSDNTDEKMETDAESQSDKSEKENHDPGSDVESDNSKSKRDKPEVQGPTEKISKPEDVSSKNEKDPKRLSLCNGIQVNFSLRSELIAGKEENSKSRSSDMAKAKVLKPDENKNSAKTASTDSQVLENEPKILSLTERAQQLLKERNVVILEDEATGSDGRLADALSGPVLCSKFSSHRSEIINRLLSTSNIIRNLSFIPNNVNELVNQRHLLKTLSGMLLLRHKHKIRKRASIIDEQPLQNSPEDHAQKKEPLASQHPNNTTTDEKIFLDGNFTSAKSPTSNPKSSSSEFFAPKESKAAGEQKTLFSCAVLKEKEENLYKDSWWWDCVQKLREDALVVFTNVSSALDLSLLHDDGIPITLLEACLHWSLCTSSDACDSFSHKPRDLISAQRLSIEILTKLSIKHHNVDLILATRPFGRLEKLFNFLVCSIGDKRDPVLREFSVVLLSNLSRGDPSAARAVALQGAAISNLITFLEESEEYGHNHRQMFRQHQHEINCGTTVFMMMKAAKTLLAMAVIAENKPSFMKHQLRLLSLSMSQYLGSHVTSIISSVLYELTHEST